MPGRVYYWPTPKALEVLRDMVQEPGPITLCERCLELWDDEHICSDRKPKP